MSNLSRSGPRRPPLRSLITAAVLAFLPAAGCTGRGEAPAAEAPPDVLLVTLDTVRADRFGLYGAATGATPHLDRLAGEGIVFEQAAAAAPLTLPSHGTILTGLLPPRHGLRENGSGRLPDGPPTLATVLGGAGYRTGAFVGAFVLDGRFGLDRGFATYDDEIDSGGPGAPGLHAERPGREVVDRALEWLAGAPADRPLFAWVHLFDAHAPYAPPEPWRGRFEDPYDGELAEVDAQVGRLLAAVRSARGERPLLVAVAGDHGEALGDHGEATHGLLLHQATVRVPLVLAGGGLPAGLRIERPLGLADLAPTLAGLAGVDWPGTDGATAPFDGRDLSAALAAGREPDPAPVYAETEYPALFGWSPLSSLRRHDWKLVAAPAAGEAELFDLSRDPDEARDLAAERPDETAALAEALERLGRAAVPVGDATAGAPADAETRARLASLGYLARSGPEATAGGAGGARDLPHPRDKVRLFTGFERAVQDLEAGRPDAAAAALAELVAADPGNPVFLDRLAHAHRKAGRPAAAVPIYRRAVEAAPDDAEAWSHLALALHEAGETEEARRAVLAALERDPERAEAHNVLGLAHLAAGRLDAARGAFERALELEPEDARLWNNLGNVLRAAGRPDEAAAAYRRAIELADGYADPENGLGVLYVAIDRPAEALPHFDRALALAPGRAEVRLNRGIAYQLLGRPAEAAADYRAVLGAGSAAEPDRRAARDLLSRLGARP